MILTLSQKNEPLLFALPFEGFSDSYSVSFEESLTSFRTHPAVQLWKGGRIDDINIQLKLAVGAIEGVVTKIDTSQELVELVAKLYNWALPSATMENGINAKVDVVQLSVGDGVNAWYRRQGFITKIQTKWMGPWDIGQMAEGSDLAPGYGHPMMADLSITIRPHFFGSTIPEEEAKDMMVQNNVLPRRKWRFDQAANWEQ